MDKFKQIKEEFKEYDKTVLEQFKMTVRDTEKGIWGPANVDNCFELFKKIKLSGNFLDIGSGDGRVVLVASLFTKSVGIEFDEELVEVGIKIRDKLGLKAELIRADYFKHDFSSYDVFFINPDTGFEHGLEDKLLKEMKPDARLYIYNNIFLPRFLKKGQTYWFNSIPVIVYKK